MNMQVTIGKKTIGDNNPIFVIAEVSANHGQSFTRAVRLIKEAKRCGADAVKFQTYTPGTMTIDVDNKYFRIDHSPWKGQTLYQLYQKAYTPWEWFPKLKKIADEEDILFFSTAFDTTAVDFLEEVGVPLHKIASFELVDIPLIEYAAKTNKPMILSTGMATLPEIKDAVRAACPHGAQNVMLLKCVSAYPAEPKQMNLKAIPFLQRLYRVPVGLSDHSFGTAVSVAAVALGAQIIEKHFTLSRTVKTPDSFFSLEPSELKELVKQVRIAKEALGVSKFTLSPEEKKNKVFRRSLFAVKDVRRGAYFTPENVRSIRPGYGLSSKYVSRIMGKKAARSLRAGTPLRYSDVQKQS